MSNERETTHSGGEKPVNGALQKALEEHQRKIATKDVSEKSEKKSKKTKPPVVRKPVKAKKAPEPDHATAALVSPLPEQPQHNHEKSLEEKDAEYADAYFARANSEEARKQAEENLIKEFYKEGQVVVNLKRLGIESEEGQKMILSALRDAGRKRNFEIDEFKMDDKGVWKMKFKAPTQELPIKNPQHEKVAPVLPSSKQEIPAETIVLSKKGEINTDEFGKKSFNDIRGKEVPVSGARSEEKLESKEALKKETVTVRRSDGTIEHDWSIINKHDPHFVWVSKFAVIEGTNKVETLTKKIPRKEFEELNKKPETVKNLEQDEEKKHREAVTQAGRDLKGERQLEKEMAKMPPNSAFTSKTATNPAFRPEGANPKAQGSSRQTFELLQRERITERFERLFHISKENLAAVEGFDKLSPGKQELVLENLKQLTLGKIREKGAEAYKKDITQSRFAARIWKSISRQYQIARHEKTTATSITTGGLTAHGETLALLVRGAQEGPDAIITPHEELKIQFLSTVSLKKQAETAGKVFDILPEERQSIDDFNKIAHEFSAIPYEWGLSTASISEQKKFRVAQEKFKEAQREILTIIELKTSAENAILYSLDTERHIRTQQFLASNPHAGDIISRIKSEKFWDKIKLFIPTIKERGIAFSVGLAIRSAMVGAMSFAAAPLAGAVVGGMMARRRALERTTEEAHGARRGVHKKFVETKKGIIEIEDKKYFSKTENINVGIEKLIKKIEGGDAEKSKKGVEELQRLLDYTQIKLASGLLDFGTEEKRIYQQYELSYNIGRSATILMERKIPKNERYEKLQKALSLSYELMTKKQKDFVAQEMWRGAKIGAVFAVGGWAVRDMIGGGPEEVAVGEKLEEGKKFIREFLGLSEDHSAAIPATGGKALVETPVSGGKVEALKAGPISELIKPDGDGIWRASRRLIGHGITEEQWREAWKNTFVEIGGEKIHVSEVGLVHKNDSVIFEIGQDGNPRFSVIDNPHDVFSFGTDEDLRKALIREGKIRLPVSEPAVGGGETEEVGTSVGEKGVEDALGETDPADVEPPESRDPKDIVEAFVGNDAFFELMDTEDINVDSEDIRDFPDANLKEKEEILLKLNKESEKIFQFIPTKENPEKFPGGFRRSYLALLESFNADIKAGNLMLLKNLETKFQIDESDFKTLHHMTLNEYRINIGLWEKGGADAVLDDAFSDALKVVNAGKFKELLNYIDNKSPDESDGRGFVSTFLKTTDLWKPLPEGKLGAVSGVIPPLEMFDEVKEPPVTPEAPTAPKIQTPEAPKAETAYTPSGLIDSVKTSAPDYLKGPVRELNLNLLPDSFKALSIAETLKTLQGADVETQKKMLPVFDESLQKMKGNPNEYPEAFVNQYAKIISALKEHIAEVGKTETVKDIAPVVVPETFEKVEEPPEAPKISEPEKPTVAPVEPEKAEESRVDHIGEAKKTREDIEELLKKLPPSRVPEASAPEAPVVPTTPEPVAPMPEAPAAPEVPTEPKASEAEVLTPKVQTPPIEPEKAESHVEIEGAKEDEGPASMPPESSVAKPESSIIPEAPEKQPESETPPVQETPTVPETPTESKAPEPEVPIPETSATQETPTTPVEPEKIESQVDVIGEAKKTSYTPIQFRRGIPSYLKSIIHSENEEAFRAYGIDKHIVALNGEVSLYEEEQALVRLEALNKKAHASVATYPQSFLESFDDVIVVLAQKVNADNEHLLENIDSKFKIDKGTYDVLKSITVQHLLDTIALIQDGKISEIPKTDPAMIKLLEEPTKFEYLAAYIQDKHPDAIDKTLSLEVYMKTVGIPDDYERHAGVLWKGLHGAGRAADLTSAGEQLQRISEIAVLEDLRNTYGISQEQYGLVYNMDIGTLLNVMDDIKNGKSGETYVANDIIRRVLHEKQANFEKLAEFIKALNPSLSERTMSLDEYLLEKLPAKKI